MQRMLLNFLTLIFSYLVLINSTYADDSRPLTPQESRELVVQSLTNQAEQGDPQAQFELGMAYVNGSTIFNRSGKKAEKWLLAAAQNGHGEAQLRLSLLYEYSNLIVNNQDKARKWLEASANSDFIGGVHRWGYINEMGLLGLKSPNEKLALSLYTKAVKQNYPDAFNSMGRMYENGKGGLKVDNEKAVQWYEKAAQSNKGLYTHRMGERYLYGELVNNNPTKALAYFEKAATEKGFYESYFYMGLMTEIGKGTPEDINKAVNYYTFGAQKGCKRCQRNLAELYYYGSQVNKDLNAAYDWISKAVKGSDDLRTNKLYGMMHYFGEGVEENNELALKYLCYAAEKGDAYSQNKCGIMYNNGWGTKKNHHQANIWFNKAVIQDYKYAKYQLGRQYLYGRGVEKDHQKALQLLNAAASKGVKKAQELLSTL